MKNIKSIFDNYKNNKLNKDLIIIINIKKQNLEVYKFFALIKSFKISSSQYGEGFENGSKKTPLGAHYIKEIIGENEEPLTIFKSRKPTNKKAKIISGSSRSDEDIICSRIFWLGGLEEGINKGSNVDTYNRYIYIHGTNEENLLGKKASHGCIRMSNNDIITLCNLKIAKAFVYIT